MPYISLSQLVYQHAPHHPILNETILSYFPYSPTSAVMERQGSFAHALLLSSGMERCSSTTANHLSTPNAWSFLAPFTENAHVIQLNSIH
ncbi:nwd2 [Moniliophthora roreri]|nr:nwd2 [Moniliophthora roreri]